VGSVPVGKALTAAAQATAKAGSPVVLAAGLVALAAGSVVAVTAGSDPRDLVRLVSLVPPVICRLSAA